MKLENKEKKSLAAFLCCQEWENNLIWEFNRVVPECQANIVSPGLVICQESSKILQKDFVFCRQLLPQVQMLKEESANKIVQHILDYMLEYFVPQMQQKSCFWMYSFQSPDFVQENKKKNANLSSRMGLLERLLLDEIKHFWPAIFKRCLNLKKEKIDRENLSQDIFYLQVILTSRQEIYWSFAKPQILNTGRKLPNIFPAWQQVSVDSQAPCRSYYKLEEAWHELGFSPKAGQICVDLGAAPGGWTWSALKRGAKVIALDDAKLATHIENHPQCQHLLDNAYNFTPQESVDWLLCDIIARPLASAGILERWLDQKLCRNFAIAIKFRGKDASSIIDYIEKMIAKYSLDKFMMRHLYFNHNEITLLGKIL